MKRIVLFLIITFSLTWGYEFGIVYPITMGSIEGVPPLAAQLAIGGAMFAPAIGVLITRLITREGFKNSLIKPRAFKKSFFWFLIAWIAPATLAVIGAGVYFFAFPQDFDPSMSTIITSQQQAASSSGADLPAETLRIMMLTQLPIAVVFGPLLNIFTAFGEEWGWRGYLMPKLGSKMRIVPCMLTTGVIWGLWHAPITALGHNYGLGYPGWPVTGILAMCGFCTVMGIFLSYVTIRTGSCLAAAIGHGALNAFVAAAVMFSLSGGNPFVGPLATGILGGSAFIVAAAAMLWDLHRREKEGTLDLPQAGLPDEIRNDNKKVIA